MTTIRLERDASMMVLDSPDFICHTGLPNPQATAPKESEATATDGITHRDVQVTNVFKYVEDMITSNTMERQFVRLVWIRLTTILDRFDEVIKSDRRTRRLDKNQGKRNASIAIKIHQESISAQRSAIKWRRRIARRWTLLTNGSPFLAIALSHRAETLINTKATS
ncbi:hypothetical protein B0J13DRAFT_531523 [Dactylonectria estremocensis]|uniref:Uncharacterized protein n=1 Tax=Dactylonectria estremocensis TaxID=1079267 RepID=A0A9P9IIJ5_9HYPO|nr:hypothetical protein B0J13DRAFT_531523 [Dactylonectria estremocensis]